MKPIMTPDIAQAIAIELDFTLAEGWTYEQLQDHFVVRAPDVEQVKDAAFLLEVERIAEFVSYAPKSRPVPIKSGELILESSMSSGNGFTIRFLRKAT